MTDAIIRAQALGQTFQGPSGQLTILDAIDLEVHPGESLAVVGPSGSGKSTLLGLLAGLDRPSEGEVWLLGQRLSGLDEDQRAELRAGRVGFVFQSFQLMAGFSALENVMLPLEITNRTDARDLAADWLSKVGLGDRMDHRPGQLSGGEQQRVAVARAFALQPEVLFADEPTGNLDRKSGAQVAESLFDLQTQSDSAVVLVTHDPALAERCQRTVTLESGRLVS
ncbi:MAG: ABC transporter ATP-binding protein [Gammaproteobacteria bacterium]